MRWSPLLGIAKPLATNGILHLTNFKQYLIIHNYGLFDL